MNYLKYYPIDVVNGPGTRCTLFVSGCEHHCKGCYNQYSWNPEKGFAFDSDMENIIIEDLQDTRIKRRGLSLSGGDPLYPDNVPSILSLVKRVKTECPTKDIWLWTGYTYEELSENQREILPYIDILVDGKYILDEHNSMLVWKGSNNQRIIDVGATLLSGNITLASYDSLRKGKVILYERRT